MGLLQYNFSEMRNDWVEETGDLAANQGVVGSNPASRARICVLDQRVEHLGLQPVFLWLAPQALWVAKDLKSPYSPQLLPQGE